MDINKEISDFLRDAQYRLALMTTEMDSLEDDGDIYYQTFKEQRWELDFFYSLLLDTQQSIEGAYNWLETAEWTEKDILNEIHYLRNKYEMNGLPVLNYQSSIHQIINIISEGDVGNIPSPVGNGDILIGNGGQWVVGSLSDYAGMLNTETLTNYFSGRS